MALDTPREGDDRPRPAAHDDRASRLGALREALRGHGITAEPDGPHRLKIGTHLVTCRPRAADACRLWYVALPVEPLAPADQMMNAITAIKGLLAMP